jgi:hypothetical protein
MNGPPCETSSDLGSPTEIEQLQARVQSRLGGRVRELQVVRLDDGLVLKGQTRTFHEKQLAQHALMKATRRPILANEIEVDG